MLRGFRQRRLRSAAEKCAGSKKPKAIIISSLVIDMLLQIAILVLASMHNYRNLDWTTGFNSAFNRMRLPVTDTIISVFTVLSILTVILTCLLRDGQSIVSWQVSAERQ